MVQKGNFKHINGYNKGMNKDLSLNLYDNKRYLDAEWLTPINPESNDIGDMVNPKGTLDKITFPNGDEKIIGSGIIRDWTIIFTSDGDDITRIYKFKDDGTDTTQTVDGINFIELYDDTDNTETYERLGYTTDDELSVVTRYESTSIQKVYFACEDHPLRWFNSALSAATIGAYTQSDFNIIPNVDLSQPEFIEYTSGNKQAGQVAYSYQLYKVNGNESSFSELSPLIPISSTISTSKSESLYGSDVETNCNIGIRFKIENLDTRFDRIRVLAFNYTDQVSDPIVDIIFEGSFSNDSIELLDTGESLGNYDISTFRIFHSFLIMPKHISQKSNIMFPANIKEKYFDIDQYLIDTNQTTLLTTDVNDSTVKFWDSRAYRFKSDGTFDLYNSAGDAEYTDLTPSDFINIPHDADCVNPYNLVDNNDYYYENPTTQQKYKIGGTIGGSGSKVTYTFTQENYVIDETDKHYKLEGPVNDATLGIVKSWQADEIYRTYIQFENYLGQKSFPKWIDDIRIPTSLDQDGSGLFASGGNIFYSGDKTYGVYTYPNFRVTRLPKNPDGSNMKWRILRVKRDSSNKTILGTAIVSATGRDHHDANRFGCFEPTCAFDYKESLYYSDYYNITPTDAPQYILSRDFLQMYIPELLFQNINLENTQLHQTEWIKLGNYLHYYYKKSGDSDIWNLYSSAKTNLSSTKKQQYVRKYRSTYKSTYTNSANRIVDVDYWQKVSPSSNDDIDDFVNTTLDNKKYTHANYAKAASGLTRGSSGTCIITQLKDNTYFPIVDSLVSSKTSAHFHIKVLVKKNIIPYGGNSYEAKLRNYSVPASTFTNDTSMSHAAKQGDTYISYFEYIRTQMPVYEEDMYQEILYIPVESQYNFNFRSDKSFNSIHNTGIDVSGKLTEEGLADEDNGIELPQLYQYNPVYSRENDSEIYIPLQLDGSTEDFYDNRIRRSQVKFNGEYSDNWLKYLQNDYLDVDAQYGPITNIGIFKDRLMYFQETGFGTVPVGEKELIPSNSSSTLALGSSGILNRYDYISNKVGSDNKHGIVFTSNNIYIYSNKYNTMYLYRGQEFPISDQLGMNSWFEQYVNTSTIIRSGYNPMMGEILYNFGGRVLVFNELNDAFVYHYPGTWTNVYYYLNNNDKLYSFYNDDNRSSLGYKHNVGERNNLYGEYLPSTVTLVINPGNTVMNVYDVLELLTEVYDSSGVEQNKTFTSIRIWNDYQDTGTITLTPNSNIKRRFRTWRFNKLRDSSAKDPKIRSSQIKVKLSFTNSSDEKIILHNLITNYRPSKMMY